MAHDPEEYGDESSEPQEYESSASTSRGSRGCGVIGCLLVIGIFVALGAGALAMGNALEPLADRFLWAPHDVVREYIAAYDNDDLERARRFLCSDVRAGRPLDPGAPFGASASNAFVEDELPYPRPGGQLAIYYRVDRFGPRAQALLEREDDGWRICAFT